MRATFRYCCRRVIGTGKFGQLERLAQLAGRGECGHGTNLSSRPDDRR